MKEFKQLVTVKEMREDRAGRQVHAQRQSLAQAELERKTAQHRLDDYRAYAAAQERRIYQELCTRVVKLREIEDVHGQVQAMRFREADYREELDTAEARREREEQQLHDDKAVHKTAIRTRDKFVEMNDVFIQQARDEAGRSEDAEIEEAAGNRPPATLAQEPS